MILNKDNLKFQRIYRSLFILPYAIPAFVSVLVWKGLLNPDYGVINNWFAPMYEILEIEPIKWLKTKESARAAVFIGKYLAWFSIYVPNYNRCFTVYSKRVD